MNPGIAFQQNLDFAVTWQADRTSGSTLHDIYARFYGVFGLAKGNQFKVSTSSLDATYPTAASDGNSNVFIAWEEWDSATSNGKIMIAKYNSNGGLVAGPVQLDNNGATATERHEVTLAIDNAGKVLASWWERKSDGTQPEGVFYRRVNNDLSAITGENETQVNNPPAVPDNVKRGLRASVATDTSGNFGISWTGNVNDPTDTRVNVFDKGYNPTPSVIRKDFRLDLAPRTSAPLHPRIARGPFSNCYAISWRDNRTGKYEVYTRVISTQ